MMELSMLAVLITCHNRKEKTLQCLKALYAADVPEGYTFDVFLVDDGSTDGTGEAVAEQYPHVNVIYGDGNLFWNRGMHLAWETAAKKHTYDYYFWLNDDTIIRGNALVILLETSQKTNQNSIVSGTTCSSNDTTLMTYGGRDKNGQIVVPEGIIKSCEYFNGNMVLIPRNVFVKVGFNDFVFHHALGDFDYGRRALKKGINSYIAPTVVGMCNKHSNFPVWCNPNKPFIQRWKSLRTPLGQNPEEFFVYESRHNGLMHALFHYFTNHLRVIFPSFWL